MKIEGVILPTRGHNASWNLEVSDGIIRTMEPVTHQHADAAATPSLLLPALCHPHIHLDKPYILTCNHGTSPDHPDYSDLAPRTGSFGEALSNTSKAKERYTAEDLYLRGSQLLATGHRQGVTSLRAFVELDHVTGIQPLTTAIKLKDDFSHLVEIQICAFAQDPIFSTQHGEENRAMISAALADYSAHISALGTTPYVEDSVDASLRNIEWAVATAIHHDLHLDFHLDYNLTAPDTTKPQTYSVIDALERQEWADKANRSNTIVIGHCTQLSNLAAADLANLADRIKSSKLPVFFVGLPTSDLFMMGRPDPSSPQHRPHHRPRGTLHVPSLIKDYSMSACLGVNNVGNAFTPYGTGDPLQLASWGVGIYQAGTVEDAQLLFSCVSWGARRAIGLEVTSDNGDIKVGDRWQAMLRVENEQCWSLEGRSGRAMDVPARQRMSFRDVVWDPPDVHLRSIIR
ncbi:hypothetical protein JX265_013846 [Neoarthrinium moseri]|uniref:Uncharacterized protein n=1 Tax=Neoarthrinium moseri TaxID=1658444 RepID=A0A9P9W7P7_9PEZI|nr:hypothetical protein JX265_013846 [Neoarthrinium moseri]